MLLALIIQIATSFGIPPYMMVAICEVESNWQPDVIAVNGDGTIDRGLMQLNSSWYNDDAWFVPEINITAAARHIVWLRSNGLTWYQVVVAYNCGLSRMSRPPKASLDYAVDVFAVWQRYDRQFATYVGK